MKKKVFKWLPFFVVAALCMGLISCGDDDDVNVSPVPREHQGIVVDGVRYNTTADGKAAVTSGGYSGNIFIPSVISFGGATYNVTSIGVGAFGSCFNLTSVTIGNGVTHIDNSAFYGCSGLTSITIPNSVTSIGDNAFWSCSSLATVTIPNSVTSIGDNAFQDCSSLATVTIPNSVTSIGSQAFWGCSSLATVTIPNSVTSIGKGAFQDCSGLTSITIPNSVTSISGYAFYGCSGLTSVICLAKEVPDIGVEAFDNVSLSTGTLYVPEVSLNAYKTARQWKEFGNILSVKGSGGKDDTSAKASYKNGILTIGKVQYKMVSVSGGTFKMGATSEQGYGDDNEKPVHNVTLSSYFIGQTEVTQALWTAVMETNPSNWKGDNLPVEQVSWDDCQSFITKLNKLTGQNFRLPTEAEWEYAARGGKQSVSG